MDPESLEMNEENVIATTQNLPLVLGEPADPRGELTTLTEQFCGVVTRITERGGDVEHGSYKQVYLCGDLRLLPDGVRRGRVIRELSTNVADTDAELVMVSAGQVPLLVHGVGVFFRRFFDEEELFEKIVDEHEFQELTESTKKSKALRTGIYMTDVAREVTADDNEVLRYRLLRCSSNLTGPTDNFRETDRMIMGKINDAAREVFEKETQLNHVLAQIYENTKDDDEHGRERKAKISAHSDKTKDMRGDGLIAFCTFYGGGPEAFGALERSESDPYDWSYEQKVSGLTTLYFKLKPSAKERDEAKEQALVEEFSITLYPNSVFIIPLSTNRLYTHAIRPSLLNVDRIPTRMGYVARSSKAEARFVDGQTYIEEGGDWIPLVPMTHETLSDLRDTYREENKTANEVAYGKVHFSMNEGDYKKPIH